jgi:O-antigen ligase
MCVAAAVTVGRGVGLGKTIVATAAASVALAVALWRYLGPEYFGAGAQVAIRIRWLFLGTTWRMLMAEPIFGLGIGQYFLWSREFAVPEMFKYYERENAHNNFAQIAGELGIVGLISFLAVLVISLWRDDREPRHYLVAMPVLVGVAAFILTWLGGHPLLVGEVSFPFWITLGVAAASVAADTKRAVPAGLVGVAVALLVVSIPFRVGVKSARVDFARVTYGVSARQLMTTRARFFVPAGESRVELPLRARVASDHEPLEIDVTVDGAAADTITLTDRNWRNTPISLSGDSSRRFHQIDLRIRPDTLDNVDPSRSSVEVGKWEIIPKPNG